MSARDGTVIDTVGKSAAFMRADGSCYGVRVVEEESPHGPHGTGDVCEIRELGTFDSKVLAMGAFRRWIANDQ